MSAQQSFIERQPRRTKGKLRLVRIRIAWPYDPDLMICEYRMPSRQLHPQAAASARAIGARAYTLAQHIVFGEGQFSPQSSQVKELLVHELVHTLQQGPVLEPGAGPPSTEPEGSPVEQEADQLALSALGPGDRASQQQAPVMPTGASVALRRIFLKRRGAAGGCGICIPDPTGKAQGVIAHTEIQAAFLAINALIQGEFKVPTAPMGEPAPFKPEVTPKKAGAGWTLIVSANSPLYDASGTWGATERIEIRAVAGAGQGKTNAGAADKQPAAQ